MLPLRTILHPTDFSEHSEYAFWLASSLARHFDARLVVLHALLPPLVAYGEGVVPPDPAPLREVALGQLEQFAARDTHLQVEHRLEDGEPATEIRRVAQEIDADLIVMGTHGRTGLGRLLLGSVAEEVVRKAACPVLTVKTPVTISPSMNPSVPEMAHS